MDITVITLGFVNCYLINTSTGLFLVDSGPPGTGPELVRAIAGAGADPRDIRLLILTHGHYDHAGNGAWLKREYGIPAAIHRLDGDYVRNASKEIPPSTSLLARIVGTVFAFSQGKFRWEGFEPDVLLDGSSDLKALGLDAGLIEFPGHTLGSIGLLLPTGELIVGDLMSNIRKPGPSMFARDIERMKSDIRSLESLGARMIYPGHGKPIEVENLRTI